MNKHAIKLLVVGLGLFGVVSFAQALALGTDELLVNGDFETGDFTGWDFHNPYVYIEGGPLNKVASFNVPGTGGAGQFARLYQNIDIDPMWRGIKVTFDYQNRANPDNPAALDYFRSLLRLELADGSFVTPIMFEQKYDSSGWVRGQMATFLFGDLTIASPGDHRVIFTLREFEGDASWARLDNVSARGIPAPVPEPATMLLLGTGIAGLAGARLRKKKK